jgi:hypothetical protein
MEKLMTHMSTGDAARKLGARPKDITDLFYARKLRDDLCPIVSGRRIIPADYLDAIRAALVREGKLPAGQVVNG